MTRQIPAVKVLWLVIAPDVVHCDAMEGWYGGKKASQMVNVVWSMKRSSHDRKAVQEVNSS
jgi:hypothetical protein